MSGTAEAARGPGAEDPLATLGRTHLIGIGGAGMSVVALLLAARGVAVQGSDARESGALRSLREAGVEAWVGHDAARLGDAATVVVSTAVREDNPELAAARAAGLRVLHRSEALALLMTGRRGVAVAGAHGKTTTSAMVAAALGAAGLDPSFAVGGTVRTAAGEVTGGRLGTGDAIVVEADESDGSFLNYAPSLAVVTNVEPDHLDHYGSREAFEQAFVEFAARIPAGGWLVACGDDPGSGALARAHRAAGGAVAVYGFGPGADVVLSDHRVDAGGRGSTTSVRGLPGTDGESVELRLRVPGEHNALNAVGALTAAVLLGAAVPDALRGLEGFLGTGRRFQPVGEAGGVRVVDDYAHHPTEVAALLRAARPVAGEGRLIVLFQPHLYSRTRLFADGFAEALAAADLVVLTGVYGAREDPEPGVSSGLIAERMPAGSRVEVVSEGRAAARAVARLARPGDLVLTVGAGDVGELGAVVLDAVRAEGVA